MCGINGIFAYAEAAPPVSADELKRTRDAMLARGPDGSGLWLSQNQRLGLAHRRLAIIDLTEAGAQPMHSADGRHVVTFNGEIYNYPELRRELEQQGAQFRSHSDTEVLLHLYRRDGSAMVEKLRGMFAFALWDADSRTLFLARDPHGIKPLYYADDGHTFRFASQVSALKAGGSVDLRADPAGAVGFLLWGSVPEPLTLHRGIRQLPAGSTLAVSAAGPGRPQRYWRLSTAMRNAQMRAATIPHGAELDYLREQLLGSVRAHLLADVPVGAFLSAGLDSSTLVGLAREAAHDQIQTLTLTFDDFRGTHNDESPMAAEIARHLDVRHRSIVLPAGEQEQEMERFLAAMDQPTIDGVNTWFVSHAATQAGLKVSLSGLGGDELLGGYSTFTEVPRLMAVAGTSGWRGTGRLYRQLHSKLGRWLGWPANSAGIPQYGSTPAGAYHLAKGVFMPWELTEVLDPDFAEAGMDALETVDAANDDVLAGLSAFEQIACLESVRYMRNQLLRDSDWASMAHSLEIRVPFVDRNLTEGVIGLAASGRLGKAKEALPRTLSKPLPPAVVSRPKTGFVVPTWRWLRHHAALASWKSVPLLKDRRMNDNRRWAYTLLQRVPEMQPLLRH
ncbi:MAG: asparagine synthase (glutamine-hydrolyzing) [Nitrospira sp.]|nr:asparagine synthase (glutamine-hydrolyzing) [Nitrospira sp.]